MTEQAFDELVRRTFVDTFTLARRLTGNEEDARDVVQEAYLRAWKGIGKFRGDAQFSTWMYRITANAASTHVHKRRRQRTEPFADDFEPADDARRARSPRLGGRVGRSARSASPVRSTSCRRSCATVVVLKDVYGLSHEAIADELGISVAAAKVRLHRAAASCATCCTKKEKRPMRCDEVAALLPGLVDGEPSRAAESERHVETCLRCQAELAALPPAPAHAVDAAHPVRRADARACSARHSPRSPMRPKRARAARSLSGRRLAYAGAIGGAVRRRRRHRRGAHRPVPRRRSPSPDGSPGDAVAAAAPESGPAAGMLRFGPGVRCAAILADRPPRPGGQ